jgi:hypothetical protein
LARPLQETSNGGRKVIAMITREGGAWVAECDCCGESIDTGQRSYQQAVNYVRRAEGWDSRKLKDGWRNFCPRCAGEADLDLDLAGIHHIKTPIDDE